MSKTQTKQKIHTIQTVEDKKEANKPVELVIQLNIR